MDRINGKWTDIGVDYPAVQYIEDYAALAIQSSVYLFGGLTGTGYIDRVVVFENNNYEDIGKLNEGRSEHEVIQIGPFV